jgi:hypothetical protein
MMAAAVPFVRAAGEPVECGYRLGRARGAALRQFVEDGLCRLHHVMPSRVSMDSLQPMLGAYRAEIAAATPLLHEEMCGLAEGAEISVEHALLLQLRREVMGYQRVPTMGDCTTYARSEDDHPVLAQTIDLNGDLDDQISVFEVARTGSARRVLVLSFGGLLGYVGVNSDGLTIGLNLVLGGAWRPGVPPYLAIRHVLDTASSVEEAIDVLGGLRLASSRSLTLCDTAHAACIEVLGDDLRVVQIGQTAHTNHFLHSDFEPRDELNVFARNFSKLRLETCLERLEGLARDADVEEHFALLSAPPICVEDMGDIRRERTVAAVVMRPDRGELHVRPGDPSRSSTQSFALGDREPECAHV